MRGLVEQAAAPFVLKWLICAVNSPRGAEWYMSARNCTRRLFPGELKKVALKEAFKGTAIFETAETGVALRF